MWPNALTAAMTAEMTSAMIAATFLKTAGTTVVGTGVEHCWISACCLIFSYCPYIQTYRPMFLHSNIQRLMYQQCSKTQTPLHRDGAAGFGQSASATAQSAGLTGEPDKAQLPHSNRIMVMGLGDQMTVSPADCRSEKFLEHFSVANIIELIQQVILINSGILQFLF